MLIVITLSYSDIKYVVFSYHRNVNLRDQHGLVFTVCKQKYITEINN